MRRAPTYILNADTTTRRDVAQYLANAGILDTLNELDYLDDLEDPSHNSWCGEQAAVNEFTQEYRFRPIEKHNFLRGYRLFKNARWIDHIYQCHVLDHPVRNDLEPIREKVVLTNPYL